MCKAAQCTARQCHGQSWYTAFESVQIQTSLNPLDLQFVFPHAQSSVLDESPESETDEHPVEVITCTDQCDDYSSSESGDSESDEDCADDRIGFHMVMSTRAGKERVFTSRMRDFLQSR